MTRPSQDEQASERVASREPSRGRTLLAATLLTLCLPLVLLALCTMSGLGLDQGLSGHAALIGALCVVILPALGLSGIFGGGSIARAAALCLWPILLLAAFPGYFPERRETATRIGLEYVSMSFAESVGTVVAKAGLQVLTLFGPDSAPSIRATRRTHLDQNTDHETVDNAEPAEPAEAADDSLETSGDRDRRPTSIAYHGDGQTIIIGAYVDGPNFGQEMQFVFDTGATLTTMAREALELLDIPIDPDAPRVRLRTASGEMEAQLVLVDAIWLEDEWIEWVTVAVCEPCASENASGLLGLNVSSHFRVSIDHDSEQIEFVPRRSRRNRRLDIQPWLDLSSVLRRFGDGRLELTVEVKNLARQGIHSSLLEVKCEDETFTVRLDPIPAFGQVSQQASLPWGSQCETFEIQPLAATWESDRF